MKYTYEAGLEGEALAERWLSSEHGMTCLERRFRSRTGEIDLIMQDRDTIVFVEVKTRRTGDPGLGLMAINRSKIRRITATARFYLMKTGRNNVSCRFDCVEVFRGEILYIPNAFQPGGMFFH